MQLLLAGRKRAVVLLSSSMQHAVDRHAVLRRTAASGGKIAGAGVLVRAGRDTAMTPRMGRVQCESMAARISAMASGMIARANVMVAVG